MAMERWGAMSVEDHLDTGNLIANVVLYDRLVFPAPAAADLPWWGENKWDPSLLNHRIAQLGQLAIRREWGEARQAAYGELQAASALDYDMDLLTQDQQHHMALGNTRLALAQEELVKLPDGVSDATVVAAFNSWHELQRAGQNKQAAHGRTLKKAADIEQAMLCSSTTKSCCPTSMTTRNRSRQQSISPKAQTSTTTVRNSTNGSGGWWKGR